ncbi:MAG: 16S rRNA (cytosine(1402)-N(4))-methyltransferase RsmH [bacterium]
MTESIHIPVMLDKVLEYLEGDKRNLIVDCTFGGGGHSREILKRYKNVKVIGIDRDLEAIKRGERLIKEFEGRLSLFHSNFKDLPSVLKSLHIEAVDAVLLDLGVSSDLLDDARRGFSFLKEGPLDMRMDTTSELTAEIVLNSYPRERLEKIFFEYGEERYARKVAKAICEQRKKSRFTKTTDIVKLISKTIYKSGKIHPATKIFQALRIEVNNELHSLSSFLQSLPSLLSVGGRVLIISFHSLEDRIVKVFFKEAEKEGVLRIITKKPVVPEQAEVKQNVRARSAKLRVAERIN